MKVASILSASLMFLGTFMLNYHVKSEGDECFYPCTYIHDPVCGDNGSEFVCFGNECFMEGHNKCNSQSKLWNNFHSSLFNAKNWSTDFTRTEEDNCHEFYDREYFRRMRTNWRPTGHSTESPETFVIESIKWIKMENPPGHIFPSNIPKNIENRMWKNSFLQLRHQILSSCERC